MQSHQFCHALWRCCCVYRRKTDCLPLINSNCSLPLSTLLFSSSDPLLVSRVNNRPSGPSSLVTGPRSGGAVEAKGGGCRGRDLGLMLGPVLDP